MKKTYKEDIFKKHQNRLRTAGFICLLVTFILIGLFLYFATLRLKTPPSTILWLITALPFLKLAHYFFKKADDDVDLMHQGKWKEKRNIKKIN